MYGGTYSTASNQFGQMSYMMPTTIRIVSVDLNPSHLDETHLNSFVSKNKIKLKYLKFTHGTLTKH